MKATKMLAHRAKDTGGSAGFREGVVEVLDAVYRVIARTQRVQEVDEDGKKTFVEKPAVNSAGVEKGPTIALVLKCRMLNAESLEPLHDADDNEIIEEISYGLGNLTNKHGEVFVRVAKGTGPDDMEPEVIGSDVGDEGNTLDVTTDEFEFHPATAYMMLLESLRRTDNVRPDIIDRSWAPDWTGAVLHLVSKLAVPTKKDDEPYRMVDNVSRENRPKDSMGPYKIVDKVIRPLASADKKKDKKAKGGEAKETTESTAKAKGDKATKAAKTPFDATKALHASLEAIAGENAGETLTFKALRKKLAGALGAGSLTADEQAQVMAEYTGITGLKKWAAGSVAVDEIEGDDASDIVVKFDKD